MSNNVTWVSVTINFSLPSGPFKIKMFELVANMIAPPEQIILHWHLCKMLFDDADLFFLFRLISMIVPK